VRSRKLWLWLAIGGGVLALVLIILVIIGGRGDAPSDTQTPTTQAAELEVVLERGDVQVKPKDAEDFSDAQDGQILAVGDTIRTESDALVSLELSTGAVVRLNETSRLEIQAIGGDALRATLVGGEAWVRIEGEQRTPVTVTTLEARVEAQGSAYDVKHGKDQSTIASIDDTSIVTALRLGDGASTTDLGKLFLSEGRTTSVSANDLPEGEEDFKENDLSKEFKESFWFRWNTEKDEEFIARITGAKDENAPALTVSTPKDGATTDQETIEVKGTTDISATVEVNDEEVENNLGAFSTKVSLKEGENTISVVAKDSAGNRREVKIKVTRGPDKPNAVTVSVSANEPLEAVISWTESDTSDFEAYLIKRDGQEIERIEQVGTRTFTDSGLTGGTTYKYQVCVVDGEEQTTCSSEKSVTAKGAPNEAPTVSISGPAEGASVAGGQAVAFASAGTDPEGQQLTYTWDFGDGVSTTGQNVSHTYAVVAQPTAYVVTVSVRDRSGATAQASITITVTP
jgi:hypothetical protein